MKNKYYINKFPWGRPAVYPDAYAEISFEKDGILVHLFAQEQYILATVKEDNGPVYKDSCLEFFFCPCPNETNAYFNFEINPLGSLYVGFSATGKREDSHPIDFTIFKEKIDIKVSFAEESWEASYKVPDELIRKYLPNYRCFEHGFISCNFYKCADDSIYPHYAVWNDIDSNKIVKPDFHLVEFFKEIFY